MTSGARRELHQAKRSHPNGKWTLTELNRDGLLRAMGEQLAGNEDKFVFVSGSEARELDVLCRAAHNAVSDEEFDQQFLAADAQRKTVRQGPELLGMQPFSRAGSAAAN